MKTRLFFTVAAFIAMTAIASAQTAQQNPDQTIGKGRAAGNVYVDADKDGVCDNYTNGTRPGRRAYSAGAIQAATNRGTGQGQGLAQGPRNGQGRAAMAGQGRGMGRATGIAPGRGRFNGKGPAFVDANNDGVCDNMETAPAKK
ncbi:MAG: hypothetical protein P1P83_11970 [Bacteroidales bacterium]|nr:hypothetical protein [Bacteroidales bacterium]MDT8374623.1 hypothetical protein [Bacteroidales bacterium]